MRQLLLITLGALLLGAAATISDYNGTSKASHIKDKLVEMAYLNENIAGTAMASSFASFETAAGNFQPDVLMANGTVYMCFACCDTKD